MFNSEKKVEKALQKVLMATGEKNYHWKKNINDLKFVVLSDQHKGTKDGADDFENNENTYAAALKYYNKEKYNLFLLGDVEELWECRAKNVLKTYPEIFDQESNFAIKNRYLRFYGNHDDHWDSNRQVRKFLRKFMGGDNYKKNICESLIIEVQQNKKNLGKILLLHGHQGTLFSDTLSFISKPILRYIYRPLQRFFKFGYTTPTTDFELRENHEKWMHSWTSEKEKLLLIAGHTHHPVFVSESHEYYLKQHIKDLESQLKKEWRKDEKNHLEEDLKETIKRFQAKLDEADGISFDISPEDKPCYFNSGCCSYKDGDITAVEVERGQIRLVRWPVNESHRVVLRKDDLVGIFQRC